MDAYSNLANLIGPFVDVRSFAAPGLPRDGATDWHGAIQAAVDYVVAQSLDYGSGKRGTNACTLYMPPGIYLISAPIEISTVDDSTYQPCSIQIIGDAAGLSGGIEHGTILVADFTEFPAVIVQCGQQVLLRNLVIQGLSDWVGRPGSEEGALNLSTHPELLYDVDNFAYTPAGKATVRTARYSPYAGIHIDPFGTTTPPDGGYPYGSSKYLAVEGGGSVGVTIDHCRICNFVVGIALGLHNGEPQNCEGITISDCVISTTQTAIATGQTENRGIVATNLYVNLCQYVINSSDYGVGTGGCPSIFGATINSTKYVFKTYSNSSNPPSINGVRVEDSFGIGHIGGEGAVQSGCVFSACDFSLRSTPEGVPALFRFTTTTQVIFNGCQFSVSGANEPMWFAIAGAGTTFNNCFFQSIGKECPTFFISRDIAGWSDRAQFNNCVMGTKRGDPAGASLDPADLAAAYDINSSLSGVQPLRRFTDYDNQYLVPGCLFFERYAPADSLRWIGGAFPLIALTLTETLTVPDPADGTATFKPDATGLAKIRKDELIFSDEVYQVFDGGQGSTTIRIVIGRVASIDGGGVVHLVNVPEQVTTNSSPLSIIYWPRTHYPSRATTNGTTTITVEDGGVAYWNVGNRIRGANIPEGAYIVGKNHGAGTLTLSHAATTSATHVRIYDADIREVTTTVLP